MKNKQDWPWRKIFAVFGLIVCVVWFILAVDTLPADFKPPYRWGEGVDSAKLFVTLVDGTMWDSTAGAARATCARYDSTLTGLSNDTGYIVICRIWDADSGKDWSFYWPVLSTVSDADMGATADSVWDKIYADMVAQAGGAGDSLWAILNDLLDTLQNHDDWIATAANLTKAIDSINALLDTLQLWDTRIDSMEAALADGSVGDKVWTDGSPTNRGEINDILDTLQLYDTRLDSLLAALADANIGNKVWTDGSPATRGEINDILDTLQLYDTRLDSLLAAASDAKLEKVWYGIDTTNIDTSEIGEWFSTGIAASLSDANIGQIADSVDSILSDAHGATAWTTGGAGSGDNDVRIYAIDTSGTDDSIMGVNITVKTIAGVFDAAQTTNSNGYRDFTLPTDSMKYLGRKVGYRWITDTINVTADDTVAIYGYNVPLQASPDPNLCRVQGYVYVPEGGSTKKITVTFTVAGEAVHNSCDSTAFIAEPVTVKTSIHEDSLGFFYADLVPSGCLLKADGDSLQYKVTQEARSGAAGKEKLIYVPQEDSYEIVW